MSNIKFRILIITLLLSFVVCDRSILADTGPKPTMDIYVHNAEESNYYLDLLGKVDEYGYFDATDGNKEYDNLHDEPIYQYEVEGWKAIHMRTWVLNGKLTGEVVERDENGKVIRMKHSFGYVGVPKRFKIIIQKSNGKLQVSEIITNNHFNAVVNYDMKENRVIAITGSNIVEKYGISNLSDGLYDYLKRILATLAIELLIAIFFGYRSLKKISMIALVNFITQTLLTLLFISLYAVFNDFFSENGYAALLLLGEIIVIIIEYLIYCKLFRQEEKTKLRDYTLAANIASIFIGFIL